MIKNIKKILTKYEKHMGLVFRVGLVGTIIFVWDNLGKVRTQCSTRSLKYASKEQQIASAERHSNCLDTLREERIMRDMIADVFPIIVFLGVSYLLYYFLKQRGIIK